MPGTKFTHIVNLVTEELVQSLHNFCNFSFQAFQIIRHEISPRLACPFILLKSILILTRTSSRIAEAKISQIILLFLAGLSGFRFLYSINGYVKTHFWYEISAFLLTQKSSMASLHLLGLVFQRLEKTGLTC